MSKSDNHEPLHLSKSANNWSTSSMITQCVGWQQEAAPPIPLNARHANNAGHDLLVEPRHDRHGDALQLLLPALIFLCFGTQIVLEPSSSLLMMVVLILAWH